MDLLGFHVVAVGAGIADVWVGESDDLPAIGWIRQDFLITGHRSIEDYFADSLAIGTDRCAVKNGAIL